MKKYIAYIGAFRPAGFLLRTETDRVLTLSMAFSTLLIVARMAYTGSYLFLFLVWNLFLAWLPYALTSAAQNRPKWRSGKGFVFLFAGWLLFIPNSFYIITDLF